MEVKPGYKQTEVGVIPEEWDVTTIGEQSQIFGRIGFRGYTVDDIVEEGHGAIAINPSNIQDGETVFEKCTYISWHKYEESPEIKIDEGDIILVKTGSTVGKTAMVKKLPGKATLNPQVVVFKKLKASPGFFGYTMGFPVVQKQLTEAVVGGALPTLSQKLVAAFKFPLPTTDEQRAIAEALSDVDGLLGGLDRLIAKKRDLKQAAMQQLLTGHTRLHAFHDKWETKRLGELFEITSSKRVFQSEWRAEGVPFYRARELAVLGETGRVQNELFITRELYEKHRRAHGVPSVGDMLVTGVGTLGKVYVVSDGHEFYFKDGNIIWFKIEGKMSADFLHQLYLTDTVQRQVAEGGAGTTVGTYTISAAKKTTIPFPKLAEQTAIAEVLTDMDAELAALEQRREKTRALKQAMMQELLTGKTRLV
ncbi:restriction endonuclease subunit S [Bradyrhizobium sp. 33ap4]|uniref:restriction endonuclease subunit S n=1 Tax=Bradyrhizobium sp. 33ap4 TaxID=3061630 RepID=UPI00292E8F75|nr:restriction endonuclease subunit S [Bradyrhizobium sp. 33ap4]